MAHTSSVVTGSTVALKKTAAGEALRKLDVATGAPKPS
jgi:hypothetical protein